eukprot:gnl/TRDRNA2_/TRDRNA2_198195_c0_seq1.p1 gnl/TRDRNA2_/TRDRNA2_198195_c0~~gnl/TRDRNA2_/TRDRNA2_198195_c0_seq1.p1  ORF type:complete len:145 (-),score=39.79 gnl/TRDRNA2_/TRDRNA2_198195_c0_seq1:238-672(-)
MLLSWRRPLQLACAMPRLAAASSAPMARSRGFCDAAGDTELSLEEKEEGFWKRRWQRIQRRRARMNQQVDAAHGELQILQSLGRQLLVERKVLSEEDAAKFARIDARLCALQRNPKELELFDPKKQFHPEYLAKKFALKKGQRV